VILLVVLALAAGGKASHQPQHPSELANGRLELARGNAVLATSDVGNMTLRLPRGSYRVTLSLSQHVCEARGVTLRRSVTVRLRCSVP
jgi:hypothetical protein